MGERSTENTPSFSSRVKEELLTLDYTPRERASILSSYVKANGVIRIQGGAETLDISSEFESIAEFLYRIIVSSFSSNVRFSCVKSMKGRKATRFHVLVNRPEAMLEKLGIDFLSNKLPKELVEGKWGSRAYLVGAFLACGYVNNPLTSNYHLEFSFSDEAYGQRFSKVLAKAHHGNFPCKVTKRRSQTIVYFKKSEKISEFLVYLGAQESCLAFESIRVDRDFANIGNRLSNLDKANDNKKVAAAERQRNEILYLKEKGILEEMGNPKIEIIAGLRLDNPDASMEALAELLSEEIAAEVSKSNVNHLFRAIHERYLAEVGEGHD